MQIIIISTIHLRILDSVETQRTLTEKNSNDDDIDVYQNYLNTHSSLYNCCLLSSRISSLLQVYDTFDNLEILTTFILHWSMYERFSWRVKFYFSSDYPIWHISEESIFKKYRNQINKEEDTSWILQWIKTVLYSKISRRL